MPPLPRIRTGAMEELARQLRFAPRAALVRHVRRVEAMAAELDPDLTYPEDWVIFRITGYRPELDSRQMLVGDALISDLSALVEHLSNAAGLTEQEAGQGLGVAELLRRWNVSKKTLDRYRRRGLVAHRVVTDGGRSRLFFSSRAVEAFEARQRPRIGAASRFTRIDGDLRRRMIDHAARYRRTLGLSLNETALRLAHRYGRGHETVRQILRRHDAESDPPIFAEHGPLSSRQQEVLVRMWCWGGDAGGGVIEPGRIARRFGRSRGTVHRVVQERRTLWLRSLRLSPHRDPDADEQRVLAPARDGLGERGETDLAAFVDSARASATPDPRRERELAAAYHHLVACAADAIAAIDGPGGAASDLDAIEVRLRWAARVKAVLMRTQLGLLVRTAEGRLGTQLERLGPGDLATLVQVTLSALSSAVSAYEPRRGGRLAAPTGLATDRAVSHWARERTPGDRPGRASAIVRPGRPIPDWTLSVEPWQRWLEPDRRVRAGLMSIDAASRDLLCRRYGWGGRPATLARLVEEEATTHLRLARRLRAALRAALGRPA